MIKNIFFYFAALFTISHLSYDVLDYISPGILGTTNKKIGFYFSALLLSVIITYLEKNNERNKTSEPVLK